MLCIIIVVIMFIRTVPTGWAKRLILGATFRRTTVHGVSREYDESTHSVEYYKIHLEIQVEISFVNGGSSNDSDLATRTKWPLTTTDVTNKFIPVYCPLLCHFKIDQPRTISLLELGIILWWPYRRGNIELNRYLNQSNWPIKTIIYFLWEMFFSLDGTFKFIIYLFFEPTSSVVCM